MKKSKKTKGAEVHPGTFKTLNEAVAEILNYAHDWFQNYQSNLNKKGVKEIYETETDCFVINRNGRKYEVDAEVCSAEPFQNKDGSFNCDLLFYYKGLLTPKGNRRGKVKPHWQRRKPGEPIIDLRGASVK